MTNETVAALIVPHGKVVDFIDRAFRSETPEEYGRQKIEKSLVKEYEYPREEIALEYSIKLGVSRKRIDLAIFPEGSPRKQETIWAIIECKSTDVPPNHKTHGSAVPGRTPEGSVRLSVVVPVYNESHRVPATLERIAAYLGRRGRAFEVLVVDDGSTDGTADVAWATISRLNIRGQVLRHQPNRGKGASVRRGMLAARGQQVLFTGADLSTPIEEIERLEAALEAGAHIAIGSRAIDRGMVERRQSRLRDGLGRLFNLVVRAAVLPGIRDSQCGFKLFIADAVEPIFSRQRSDGFGFDVEALAIARLLGYSIAEIPVRWINDPDSRVGVLQRASAFLDPLRVRVRILRGDYHRPSAGAPIEERQADRRVDRHGE